MERIVEFWPAYDRRSSDPAEDYGIGPMKIRFILKGEKGAVQFLIGTNWFLPGLSVKDFGERQPVAWDLGYHSYKMGATFFEECDVLGGPCYYDGSTLAAEPIRDRLVSEGSDAVWEALEEYYEQVFGKETHG